MWAVLNDEAEFGEDRDFAALDLLVWFAKGGSFPMEGLRPRSDAIERCERRLVAAIEGS